MSTVGDFLFSRLTLNVGVAGLVGTRVYPVKMPDNSDLPTVTYQVVSGEQVESLSGSSGLACPVYQIDAWATSPTTASNLVEKLRLALEGYSGTFNDLTIFGIAEWSSRELYDPETEIFHVSASCRIWHTVAQP